MQPVTEKQRALAEHAGILIAPTTPSIVASALLRIELAKDLHLAEASPINEYLESRIEELSRFAPESIEVKTREEGEAWVSYLQFALRRECLKKHRITAGDVVRLADGELAIVSTIGDDGRVYFKGGKGYKAWPDLIEEVGARNDDDSPPAKSLRVEAQNAAARRSTSANWSTVKSDDLSDFKVESETTLGEIDELEKVIAKASDEKPIQQFLQEHPQLLTSLLGGTERFCIQQKRLGAEFVPDFVIGDVDSLGIRWVLVEIETPRSRIYLNDASTLDKYARKGIDQIIDWRQWLSKNVAYAQAPIKSNGLGLYDINSQSEGLVLVGRQAQFPTETKDSKRRALRDTNNIQVHTYDWLLERLRGAITHQGPPASNPHLIHKEVPDQNWRR